MLPSDTSVAPPEPATWNLTQLIGFRFALVYVVLYTLPFPFEQLPLMEWLVDAYHALWDAAVPWIGRAILHLPQPVSTRQSGSGDKLFDWVQVLAMLAIAAVAATAWTALERRRQPHPRLVAAFEIYLRVFLATTLLGYGLDKVFPNQFEPMGPLRLTQFVGEASPGGYAWSFLGYSVPYMVFAGMGETAAAALLVFRRTAILGAIVGAAVMTNVFMLNMSFDIPVKQFSFHLLAMCGLVLAFESECLVSMLFHRRACAPRRLAEVFTTPRSFAVARGAGVVFGLWVVGTLAVREYTGLHSFGRLAPHGPLYGIFEVQDVLRNGVVQPGLLNDATRWRRLAASNRVAVARLATDSTIRYRITVDTLTHMVTMTELPDTLKREQTLAYAFPDASHLVMRGKLGADSVEMRFTRRPEESYLLVNRGFHWVNEVPYFR